jgi:hypothetical protein
MRPLEIDATKPLKWLPIWQEKESFPKNLDRKIERNKLPMICNSCFMETKEE